MNETLETLNAEIEAKMAEIEAKSIDVFVSITNNNLEELKQMQLLNAELHDQNEKLAKENKLLSTHGEKLITKKQELSDCCNKLQTEVNELKKQNRRMSKEDCIIKLRDFLKYDKNYNIGIIGIITIVTIIMLLFAVFGSFLMIGITIGMSIFDDSDIIFRVGFIIWSLIMGFTCVCYISSINNTNLRLHDIGKSGWNLLWCLTIVGIIPVAIWLSKEGQLGKNKYGVNPKELKELIEKKKREAGLHG